MNVTPPLSSAATQTAPPVRPLLAANFSVDYPDRIGVVRNIELNLAPGDILGLVGASGSGKSTIANTLMGLTPLQGGRARGQVRFEGVELLGLKDEALQAYRGYRFAMVMQSPLSALNPALTIGQQMCEAWRAHRHDDWEEPVCQALELACLPQSAEFLDLLPNQLSVGLAQRVLIAMAILHRPSLLIVDEPTSALDIVTAGEILALFRSLNRDLGTGILMISHDLGAVATLCQRVSILQEGAIVESGSREQIFRNPRHPYTRRMVAALAEFQGGTPPLEAETPDAAQDSLLGLLNHSGHTMAPSLLDHTKAWSVIEDPGFEQRTDLRSQLEAEARAQETTPSGNGMDLDPVTGLFNSRGLFLGLDREIARLRRSGNSLSMIVTSIEDFAALNRQYGRAFGENILKAIARKLRDQSREYDVLARTDADEFVLVLPEFPVKYLEGRIARLESGAAAAAGEVIGDSIALTFATAYANCPEDGQDAESLLALAATRLHELRQERAAEAAAETAAN
jgi:peptide/nickel transport system ATP-binding protein